MTNNCNGSVLDTVSVSAWSVSWGKFNALINWLQSKLREEISRLAFNILPFFMAAYSPYTAPLAVRLERPIRRLAFFSVIFRSPTVTAVFRILTGKASSGVRRVSRLNPTIPFGSQSESRTLSADKLKPPLSMPIFMLPIRQKSVSVSKATFTFGMEGFRLLGCKCKEAFAFLLNTLNESPIPPFRRLICNLHSTSIKRVVSWGFVDLMVAFSASSSADRVEARNTAFWILIWAARLSSPMKRKAALLVNSKFFFVSRKYIFCMSSFPFRRTRPQSCFWIDDKRQRNRKSAPTRPPIDTPSCKGNVLANDVRSISERVWNVMSGSPNKSFTSPSANISVWAPLNWKISRWAYDSFWRIKST